MVIWKNKLYPLVAIISGLFIVVFGLVIAKRMLACSIFLGAIYIYLILFGCFKECLKVLPLFVIVSGIFFGIFYLATNTLDSGWAMANRLGAVFIAVIPGMATSPVRMTRALSTVKTPRCITLGMLIAMSFIPLLSSEIKRVKEAMKTRGAGNILNPKILYRAFLIPLVMRLVNISDTLALSVETRGFTLSKAPYTIYKKENLAVSDLIFILGLLGLAVGVLFI